MGRMRLVTLADIEAAASAIEPVALRTPALRWTAVEDGWLKPESLQPVGSFKVRGATNAMSRLPAERLAAGVITHSSGNHGQALAYAGQRMGVPVVVVMPDVAPPVKIAATRRYGAEVVLVPPAERFSTVARLAEERGLTLVPPYDHPDIIAGQGTVGLEIIADLPDVQVVVVPVGGGGLASGVASAVKALAPHVAVIGVEPADAADAAESLAVGEIRTWSIERMYRTIADGLRTQLSELTFAHLHERLDAIVTVTDQEILATVREIASSARLVAEPSGAVAPAALLHRRHELPAGRAMAVISGGNVEPDLFAKVLTSH
jgi:threonine dehydratase